MTEDRLRRMLASGQISSEELSLAAMCGHAASQAVLGSASPTPAPDIWNWACDLHRDYGPQLATRAQVAAVRWALPHWDRVYPEDARPALKLAAIEAWLACPECFDLERVHHCGVHEQAKIKAGAAADEALSKAEAAAFDEAMRELMLEFLRDAPRVSSLARLDLGGLLEHDEGLLAQKRPLLRVLRGGLFEFMYLSDGRCHSDIHDEKITVRRVAEKLGASAKKVVIEGKRTTVLAFPRSALDGASAEPTHEAAMWTCKAVAGMGIRGGASPAWSLYALARGTGERRRPATDSRPSVRGTEVRAAIRRVLVPAVD